MDEIELVRAENKKLHAICSIYAADKESALTEQLNSISARLKVEYTDFQDALDMEMTVALGDNMRCQLDTIFRILEKAGMQF